MPVESVTVPLSCGSRFGAYQIVAPLGAGGMGEVYRARDTQLHRDVAIKVLPDRLIGDPERLARFDREARLLASLNHPNIGSIYGLQADADRRALILELVEGDTLAARLTQPLSLHDSLDIGRQIALALEAAHERGIVHRDLKPANIKIAPNGIVKVLDFGLAKAIRDDDPSTAEADTVAGEHTRHGIVLGTPAYMSPEQARGADVDRRTDIWSFGCVLFEMLSGRPAFDGKTMSDTMAAVLERAPAWSALPPSTPAVLLQLLERCLTKDRRQRLRDIGDALFDLEERDSRMVPGQAPPSRHQPARVPWAIAAAFGLALAGVLVWTRLAPPGTHPERLAFVIPPPEGVIWGSAPVAPLPAASPDGRKIAFVSDGPGGRQLWIHDVQQLTDVPLSGTADATRPAWSADSQSVAYCVNGVIKMIGLAGRAPDSLPAPECLTGVSWGPRDRILYAAPDGLWSVSVENRQPVRVTTTLAGQRHAYPSWVNGGRQFVYLARSESADDRGIFLGWLDGRPAKKLAADEVHPIFVDDASGVGRLLFVRGATLVSQSVEVESGALVGETAALAQQVGIGTTVRSGAYDASGTLLVYRGGGGFPRSDLVWYDRDGKRLHSVESRATLGHIALSPDETTLASERFNIDKNEMEIWLTDLERGVPRPLRAMPYTVGSPIWSPDGSRLAFTSTETGFYVPFELTVNAGVRPLLRSPAPVAFLSDWSSDGQWILGTSSVGDLVALPADAASDPRVLSPAGGAGRFSPDGQWVAFRAVESGVAQIYIQHFPDGGQRTRVSKEGGVKPAWRGDGRELFYRTSAGTMMAVDVTADPRLRVGEPRALFTAPFVPGSSTVSFADYVVSRDGQRFLIEIASGGVAPLTAIHNWQLALQPR